LYLSASSGNSVQFFTNGGGSTRQFQVSHTASAVNYVQVTGAATGGSPVIQSAGSDANIGLGIVGKGTGVITFTSNGGEQFRVQTIANAVNNIQVYGQVSGQAPTLISRGSDTNVGLIVSSKGTGTIALSTGVSTATQVQVSDTASAVNYIQMTGATTGSRVSFTAQGSDSAIGITYGAKGSQLHAFSNGEGTQFAINAVGATIANRLNVTASATGQTPSLNVSGTDTNIDLALTTKGIGAVNLNTGGGLQVKVTDTASAVNFMQLTGAVTTGFPVLQATGSDTNVGLLIRTKGTPAGPGLRFENNSGANVCAAIQMSVSSPVNYPYLQPAATGSAPTFAANGTDANIDLALTPKGTGNVVATAPIKAQGYTVATLPTAGTIGRIAYVTDALAPTYLGVLTGGGAIKTPVFDNGTAWVSF